MINIEGYINKIIFHNKENNYYILSIFLNEDYDFIDGDYISVVGTFNEINFIEDELYLFKGEIVEHKKYGKQLSAIAVEQIIKQNKEAIISYLSSSNFKGIGKKTAEIIVDTLGLDCLNIIYDNKEKFFEIKNIPNNRKEIIYNTIIANKHTQDILLKLNEFNLSSNQIMKIYNKYKSNTLNIINNYPYSIIDDIKGISFYTVDKIAEKVGISSTDKYRISSAIIYTISNYCYTTGNTFIKENNLLYHSFNVLYKSRSEKIEKEDILLALEYCLDTGKLISKNDDIFLPEIFYSEYSIYNNIINRINNEDENNIEDELFDKYIEKIEKELNIKYDITQIDAIKNAINKNFSIITGGPGTGKTTILLGIIKIFQIINNYSYSELTDTNKNLITLCAPTGKAAKRMTESTGFYSSTIHKLIGWTNEDENIKEFTTDKYINSKLVIIDEASMIDIFLMSNLLKAISSKAKIVIVGDDYQLPSIAPGNVLNDLINTKIISTVKLNKIFRQQEKSSIIDLSHSIKNNINIDILEQFNDREFNICSKNEILDNIKTIYAELHKNNTIDKIQILAPIYKGPYGINEINRIIQENFNDNEIFIDYGENIYKLDDRVMQLVNRPEDNIFNGDIGIVYDIYKENNVYKIVIDYDNNFVTYEKQDLSQICLAYCSSIHKSQGSEFEYVIIPLVDNYNFMLNKNLVYTAITRTKNKLFLCGYPNVFYNSISSDNEITRNTMLKDFFIETTEYTQENNYILNYKNINLIDPMIGMDDIIPEDFIEN